MPGPVVHTIIAEHLPDAFDNHIESGSEFSDIGDDALRDHRNALVYGAQGPDPFFFNPNDWVGEEGVATAMTTWSNLRGNMAVAMYRLREPLIELKRDFKDEADSTIKEASASENPQGSQIITESKNLLVRIREVLAVAGRVVSSFLKRMLLDLSDPFGIYISPLQTCGKRKPKSLPWEDASFEKNHELWYWFDNLHSRLTGDFVTELLDIATGEKEGADGDAIERDLLQSYAIGYLSHFAADIVGHAYVNSITGGPYRLNQAQRHTTQEKVMDVWAYNRYYRNEDGPDLADFDLDITLEDLDGDDDSDADEDHLRIDDDGGRYYRSKEMVDSAMHRNFQFTSLDLDPRQWSPDQTELINFSREKPINGALELPDEIADNVALAANRAYPDVYGPLEPGEVASSYRAWYKNFQSSTSEFSPADPSEFPSVDLTGPLQRELEELGEQVEDLPDAVADVIDALFNPDQSVDLGNAAQCARNVAENAFGDGDTECLERIADSINNFLTNLATAVAELFREVAEVAREVIELMETAWATVRIRVWNFLLQKIYEALFAAYKDNLLLTCAIGFGSMYSEDLTQSQLRNLWNPQAIDASGRRPKDYIVDVDEGGKFPRKGMQAGHTPDPEVENRLAGLVNQAHLLVPFGERTTDLENAIEQDQTMPGPTAYGTNTPEVFIHDPGNVAYDDGEVTRQEVIPHPNRDLDGAALENREFSAVVSQAVTERTTVPVQLSREDYYADTERTADVQEGEESGLTRGSMFSEPILGDAVSFTLALFDRYRNPDAADLESGENQIPNLNLSGDRAIGFPTWANAKSCEKRNRTRWQRWNGDENGEVPWLVECEEDEDGNCKGDRRISPVFVPDPEVHY